MDPVLHRVPALRVSGDTTVGPPLLSIPTQTQPQALPISAAVAVPALEALLAELLLEVRMLRDDLTTRHDSRWAVRFTRYCSRRWQLVQQWALRKYQQLKGAGNGEEKL